MMLMVEEGPGEEGKGGSRSKMSVCKKGKGE